MGTFLTYRIAGGEAGMRHFMAQFGPALKWPWTKLMDVPELTDELVDTIVAQSDEQAGGLSVRELERVRDDCLVSVLQALRARDYGAGAVLAAHEAKLAAAASPRMMTDDDDVSQPLALHGAQVAPDWVDYNGHAHESRYLQVFGDASDALFAYLGIDAGYLATGSYFTVESHLSHLREALLDDRLSVTTQVLGWDGRRLHVFHSLWRQGDGELLATAEQLFLHVDTVARRAAPASAAVLANVGRIAAAHAELPDPERAGRSIGIV
jgi:carnitine 3-dehydrogenase